MKQQAFEDRYIQVWQDFEKLLETQEKNRQSVLSRLRRGLAGNSGFAHEYRRLCHLQALAHQREYSTHLLDRLDNLAMRGYQILYRPRSGNLGLFIDFLLFGFPRLFRQEYRLVITATLLLYFPALVFFLAVLSDPELIYSVMPPSLVSNLEEMYNPANDIFGSGRDAGGDLQMFGHYIWNNIGIAFRTFASGIFLGLGAIYIMTFNGLVLGGASAWMVHRGYGETFFSFVIGHGSFELTAITIAGAAGLKLGFSLLKPGQYTRREALRRASVPAVQLVGGAGVMLLIAAFIEGYWSSSSTLLPVVKFSVGSLLWILVFSYLLLSGRQRAAR